MILIRPENQHLASFVMALERGWSPNSMRGSAAIDDELARVHSEPHAYLAGMDDPDGKNPPFLLPDGSTFGPLPSIRRWMWDGEFCGLIALRWQTGTMELPSKILGHIGYTVVPWKRGRGYAQAALAQMLPYARDNGFPFVDLTTDPDNEASRRVIEANGGILVRRFSRPAEYGGTEALHYRVYLE